MSRLNWPISIAKFDFPRLIPPFPLSQLAVCYSVFLQSRGFKSFSIHDILLHMEILVGEVGTFSLGLDSGLFGYLKLL